MAKRISHRLHGSNRLAVRGLHIRHAQCLQKSELVSVPMRSACSLIHAASVWVTPKYWVNVGNSKKLFAPIKIGHLN